MEDGSKRKRRGNRKDRLKRDNTEKWKQNIPRKGIARPQSQLHVSVNDLYIPTIILPILLQEQICGPILGIYV